MSIVILLFTLLNLGCCYEITLHESKQNDGPIYHDWVADVIALSGVGAFSKSPR